MAEKTYKVLIAGILASVASDTPDLKAVAEQIKELEPMFAQQEKALAALTLDSDGLKEALEQATTELDAAKAKIADMELAVKDPNAFRMNQINDGKLLEVTCEEDGINYLCKFRFTKPTFIYPGKGEMQSKTILAKPNRYMDVITRLIDRKSPILELVSRTEIKTTKKGK